MEQQQHTVTSNGDCDDVATMIDESTIIMVNVDNIAVFEALLVKIWQYPQIHMNGLTFIFYFSPDISSWNISFMNILFLILFDS